MQGAAIHVKAAILQICNSTFSRNRAGQARGSLLLNTLQEGPATALLSPHLETALWKLSAPVAPAESICSLAA